MNKYETTSKTIIKYALDIEADKAVYINKAERENIYKCFECENEMSIVRGDKNQWHFRHKVESDCTGGKESALHKLWKQIIVENNEMKIPGGTLVYLNPKEEKKFEFDPRKPDVTALLPNGKYVYFEVIYTNAVEKDKREFYKKEGLHSLEIDLRGLLNGTNYSDEEWKHIILNEVWGKRKIYWDETEKEEVQLVSNQINFNEPIKEKELISPSTNNYIENEKVSNWQNRIFVIAITILIFVISFLLFKRHFKRY